MTCTQLFQNRPPPNTVSPADAILSTNFPSFVNILARPDGDHADIDPRFVSFIIDRFIQLHPPNFTAAAKSELQFKVSQRYEEQELTPPEVLAALDLIRVLSDRPANALAIAIQKTGPDFTRDEDTCANLLQTRQNQQLISEEQVACALTYTTVSQTYIQNPSVFVAALRRVLPAAFSWQDVVTRLDQRSARVSPTQFLRLYNALVPIARDDLASLDIQHLWGGNWENPETQLSFLSAFASLSPEQLDATSIPGVQLTFTIDEYADSSPEVRQRATEAAKHPLASLAAISSIFHTALHSTHASTNVEARRLFKTVVVPNIDIFIVSASVVAKPWPDMAIETLTTLFEGFLYKQQPNWDFVFDSLWRKNKEWVIEQLVSAHARQPGELPIIFEHAVKHGWLNELIYLVNGFGLDLVAYAHGQGFVDLTEWAANNVDRKAEFATPLLHFLEIKSALEAARAEAPALGQHPANVPMNVRTVAALLSILESYFPTTRPIPQIVDLQRQCIAVYPRLINYGEGFDDIIAANELNGHTLPPEANTKMEEHFKKMYGNEIEVREVVRIMDHYKRSRDPLEQDIFACMINSLFEEYSHFGDYPVEALATTAVLFGGLMSHKLISDLPLKVGLGMILEAIRDHKPDEHMFKFGLQALMQLYPRFREWPGFCRQLLTCKSLQGHEAWKKATDVVREYEEEPSLVPGGIRGGDGLTNGNADDGAGSEQPPFASINVDPTPPTAGYEDPDDDTQGKIQFMLNNVTASTITQMFQEVGHVVEARFLQWFASHLVEERAKMQPNYHQVYLQLVSLYEDRSLWAEILRATYASVSRMLNSEATMQNSTERTHLKNLGGWLGLLTLARDKPIRQRNIAFKQLLIEAHDTKRLIVVIPFVCKVLSQGEQSNVFKPPNPWLMDIIHFLIDLYHNAELKLNLKFEIEVLCQTLSIDHKSIEPSGEILNRVAVELPTELPPDALESFDTLSLNGLGHAGVGGAAGALAAHGLAHSAIPNMANTIPELITSVNVPMVSEMVVTGTRLEEIVRSALVRALQDIIQQVVDRSVAIAAIATQQMIHKDFATEPDENRLRTAAISMAKATAGSLALVTSKEPLRANFSNYLRTLSSDLPQGGLPEGTVIMCVNSNLDLASSVIEKATEERAAFEIEDMIEPDLENRRRHRAQRPNDPFLDHSLSRWAAAIPSPYKLAPNNPGLNADQMAIYDDFARHPRPAPAATATAAHVASASDATRSLANEVLQDQYSSLPNIPSASETPASAGSSAQLQGYPGVHGANANSSAIGTGLVNGRPAGPSVDVRAVLDRVNKLVHELQRAATEASEEHFSELPRPHPVLDVIDALVQTIIKAQLSADDFPLFAADHVCPMLFSAEERLTLESVVHVLETLRKLAGPLLASRISHYFHTQPGTKFLRLPLIAALLPMGLLDWSIIDAAMSASLKQRKENSIVFFTRLLEQTLMSDSTHMLYAELANSLAAAWAWVDEEPNVLGGQEFKATLLAPTMASAAQAGGPGGAGGVRDKSKKDQAEYVFEEWVHLWQRPQLPETIGFIFAEQMRAHGIISTLDGLNQFLVVAIDKSVDQYEFILQAGGSIADAYAAIDSLADLVAAMVQASGSSAGPSPEGQSGRDSGRVKLLDSVLSLSMLVVNHHFVQRGDLFNQRVFYRFFSMLLNAISNVSEHFTDAERNEILFRFAARFNMLGPNKFEFFTYAWADLIKHRLLMPALLQLPGSDGPAAFTKLLKQLLSYTSRVLKLPQGAAFGRELLRISSKLLAVLQHDFPDYVAANHVAIYQDLPPNVDQLLNVVLSATPSSVPKPPDAAQPGLRLEQLDEATVPPVSQYDPVPVLSPLGLTSLLSQALASGPTEEIIAHIKYAMGKTEAKGSSSSSAPCTWGLVPMSTNLQVVDAVVLYIGNHAAARAQQGQEPGGAIFAAGRADVATLSMLLHELSEEGRYFMVSSMVNQLRYPNAHTVFFGLALLDMFGRGGGGDMADPDPEENEIQETICRVLFERLLNYWPRPWGLTYVALELVRTPSYYFTELPFIKAQPDVSWEDVLG